MSYEIFRHKDFDAAIKRLAKRHRSIADDYADFLCGLQENPFQGVELCPNIRKIRMAITSKGRGNSGSARSYRKKRLYKKYFSFHSFTSTNNCPD